MVDPDADWITHSAIAGIIAYFIPIESAFAGIAVGLTIGFLSHWILDIIFEEFFPWPPLEYWWWFITQGALVIIAFLLSTSILAISAIIGALLPDIIDGFYGFIINKGAWKEGKLLLPFHKKREDKDPSPVSLGTNIFVALASFAVFAKLFKGDDPHGKNN